MIATALPARLNVPGPRAPGRLGRFRNVLRFAGDSIGFTRDLFATYGPVVSLAAGGRTMAVKPPASCL